MAVPTPSSRHLRRRYALALSLIAAFSGLSYAVLRHAIRSHESSAAVLNYSGKRRYLSQKSTLHSLEMAHARDAAERERSRELLREATLTLEQTHLGLLNGNARLGLPGNPSPAMRALYFAGPAAIDPLLREFIGLLKTWAALPAPELRPDHPVLARIRALGPGPVIARLDSAVSLYQAEAERETDVLQALEATLLILTLALLALEALFIFHPLVRSTVSSLERLDRSRSFLDSVINAIPDPVFVKDAQHRWLLVNDRFCSFVGRPRAEILGKTDHDFFPREMADLCWRIDDRVFATEAISEDEEILRDAHGELRTVLIKKTLARDPSGNRVLVAAIRDISALRAIERNLIQSSKMASLGEAAAGIAHEIKSPLTVISMRAGLLKDHAERGQVLPPEIVESTQKIEIMVEHVDRIVRSLKTFSRQDFHDPLEQVPLSVILRDTLELTRIGARDRQVSLVMAPLAGEVLLECHRAQICQVLINLVNNAIDAVERLDDRWVRVETRELEDSIELSVTDSGSGIPSELREKILEPFFTTKPAGAGTGLGLTISRRLVDQHRGQIHVDPASPNTRFVVRLPKAGVQTLLAEVRPLKRI